MKMKMINFYAQSILSIQQSKLPETVPVKTSEPTFSFLEENKELYSRFNAACLQKVKTKSSIHVTSFFVFLGTGQLMTLDQKIFTWSMGG